MENCFTFSDEELGALADYDEIGYEPEYYLMDGSKSTALKLPPPQNVREVLMRTVAIWQSLDADAGAWLRESFVLRVGRDFIAQPLPDQRCQMRPQACFANAAYIVRHAKGQSLRYCEGFAMGLAHHHVFHHAWAVDGDNRVIDATLSDPTKYEFFGYPMSMRERAKWVTRLNNSVMMDGFGVNVDFLLKHCPSLI